MTSYNTLTGSLLNTITTKVLLPLIVGHCIGLDHKYVRL